MNRNLQDDCFLHDEDRLSHDKALAILRERVAPIVSARQVAVAETSGRILAEKITAPRDIPGHTNAAVDGYAFAFSDYNEKKGRVFRAEGRIAAGHASKDPLVKGTASRIFTGGTMPKGADTVVMQEDTEARDRDGKNWVAIPGGLKQGANCRLAGEDIKAGTVILEPGCRLRPQDIAAAAAAGRNTLACFNPLRVAVYSTG
ncbi:MAG: molybdopterin molybdenumtransferase MoeA, partial [Hyphomicrobiales bacterium]|nr:molybdopterin molybdenumtransferase MoeA [Hyphomicrobiales bacterium]